MVLTSRGVVDPEVDRVGAVAAKLRLLVSSSGLMHLRHVPPNLTSSITNGSERERRA